MKITITDDNGRVYQKVLSNGAKGVSPEVAINTTLHMFQEVYTPIHVAYTLYQCLDPELFECIHK